MNKRYIGAVIYLVPTLIMIYLGGDVLKYGLMILSLMGLKELFEALENKGINAFRWVGYLGTVIYYALLGNGKVDIVLIGILITIIMLILLSLPVFVRDRSIVDSACTLFSVFYVSGLISLIYLIGAKNNGVIYIWLIFISSWSCDTAAYFIGKNFGTKKIAPEVSPNKTFEGSAAGLLASAIACVLYGMVVNSYFMAGVDIFHLFIIGLICGVVNQIGDLTASSIKRQMKIKDFSNLIPGHGGILDRFDSILFASSVIYCYIVLFI